MLGHFADGEEYPEEIVYIFDVVSGADGVPQISSIIEFLDATVAPKLFAKLGAV